MKKFYSIIVLFLGSVSLFAQAPEGIIYQAEARDHYGKVIADQSLEVQISILEGYANGTAVWEELHKVVTTDYGMFTLVIGTGANNSGFDFSAIEWGENKHFLNVKVKRPADSGWIDMGTSQFLSVPYALYAKSAGSLSEQPELMMKSAPINGVISQNWSLFGNGKSNPDKDKLGTTDKADLVFVTNNQERLRITAEGKLITADGVGLELGGNLKVNGDSTYIGKDLYVGGNVYLNVDENLDPRGETVNEGDFTVANGSKTLLTGDLHVNETTYTRSLEVTDNVPDGNFLATFENTNNGNGDGIKIKLGKVKSNTQIPDLSGFISEVQQENIKKLLRCDIDANTKINLLKDITLEGLNADLQMIGGLTVGIGNMMVDFINVQLGLPLKSPTLNVVPLITTFPGFHLGMPSIAGIGIPDINIPSVQIGPYNVPSFTMVPEIPDITLNAIGIPEIDIKDLGFWGIPDICLYDVNANVLNHENEFIRFTDHADNKMGSVRAASVADWAVDCLNPVFMFKLRGALTSGVDKLHSRYHFRSEVMTALKGYAKLGVEYDSGNGDYAEWLERMDPGEIISAGDIVAVKGGKITKNLSGAEQVMVVSSHPIVLGNMPEESKIILGNKIAFMGQIPVKIMGPVATGDFIVGSNDIPGYGRAVNPNDMKTEDYKYAVGRSWEENSSVGPKLVNTVVGVHNGDFINILKRLENERKETVKRIESLESKMETLTDFMHQKGIVSTSH